ncbi:MAG TPA: M14 family metallopeptidase [Gemmatimonadales bacterium]|nr:M14 family metallopeptidase [Gemmatimonadales bacterium]
MRYTLLLGALIAAPLAAQATRPERTEFRETSSHADVLQFLDSLSRASNDLRGGTLAISPEGRRVPYVVAARPVPVSPAEAHRSGKPIVYLQANIHAGEIEGKEAAQMLLRDLTRGRLRPLLDSVILLVVPILNADGNERLAAGERNRPGQNGPAVVGQNTNGQGLNLNRDFVKLEAPETRGVVDLIARWDPDLLIDLHTTNGSYHGYVLTYAPSLNPNGNPAADFVRDRFLPVIRGRMERRHRQQTFWYGNFRNQDPDSLIQGWETYDARPRFGTNWMGLRGRLAILSEAYSNADLQTRIVATYNFVHEVLSLAAEEKATIKSLLVSTDQWKPDSIAVRSVLGAGRMQPVIAEITRSLGEGSNGFARRQRTGLYRTIRMPVFDRFQPARKEPLFEGYIIPPRLRTVVDLLRRQAIAIDSVREPWKVAVQRFTVDTLIVGSLFEGHRTVQVEGRWDSQFSDTLVGRGWYLVRTRQALGVLAAYLLEPESEDGVVTWNLVDRDIQAGRSYPILRVRSVPGVAAVAIP